MASLEALKDASLNGFSLTTPSALKSAFQRDAEGGKNKEYMKLNNQQKASFRQAWAAQKLSALSNKKVEQSSVSASGNAGKKWFTKGQLTNALKLSMAEAEDHINWCLEEMKKNPDSDVVVLGENGIKTYRWIVVEENDGWDKQKQMVREQRDGGASSSAELKPPGGKGTAAAGAKAGETAGDKGAGDKGDDNPKANKKRAGGKLSNGSGKVPKSVDHSYSTPKEALAGICKILQVFTKLQLLLNAVESQLETGGEALSSLRNGAEKKAVEEISTQIKQYLHPDQSFLGNAMWHQQHKTLAKCQGSLSDLAFLNKVESEMTAVTHFIDQSNARLLQISNACSSLTK